MAFAAANGVTLHYVQEGGGDGIPLLFINSLGTDLRLWDGILPHFAGRSRVIRYDKRGHGLSDCPPAPYSIRDHAADLLGLLDWLDVPLANVAGISVGGMIALDFAATWPERVNALVLCDTGARIGTAEMWNERINTLRERGIAYLAGAILSRWFAPGFAQHSAAAYRGYYNMLTRTPIEGYIGTCEAIRDADLTLSAQSIRASTLVLCGAEDMATPPDLARGLVSLIPNASYAEIPGAAHLPCIEQPDVMAALLQRLL
jgi:3-oxoadipate enol-lactonase